MGDQQKGHAQVVHQTQQQFQDLVLDGDVEGRGRLVGQQQGRLGCQGDGDHRTLAHAAGEFVSVLIEPLRRRRDANQTQQFDRPGATLRTGQGGVGLQRFLDLQADGQHRVQRGCRFLEDHADAGPADGAQTGWRGCQQVLAAPVHMAGYRGVAAQQAADGTQGDAFAAAGFADQTKDFAGADGQRDIVDGSDDAAGGGEGDSEVLDREQRVFDGSHRLISIRSARPSPVRLKPRPQRTIAAPGKRLIQGAWVKKFLPSAISTPHSAVGGCAPRPR